MLHVPHDFQASAIKDIVQSLRDGLSGLWVSPTGSGKSVAHAGVMESSPAGEVWCVVPSVEIAIGIHKALGLGDLSEETEATQRKRTEAANIYTSMRALRLAEKGENLPKFLLFDEAHHGIDNTHKNLRAICGSCPVAGLTATDYRGTPQGTGELLAFYGPRKPTRILTEKESIRRGVTVLPEFSTVPLLDDETIDVTGGEFVVKSVESALRTRIEQLEALIVGHWNEAEGLWSQPTTVVLPSAGICEELRDRLTNRGYPATVVLAGTRNRQPIFKDTVERRTVLLQMRVVGEGVDLPLRTMIDCAPTMSPVLWMQRVGRIRRPGGNSRYLSCCHNLLRHGYLFEGLIPESVMASARRVWGADWKPSRRMMARALGMTGFGRFKPAEVPMADGETLWMYAMKAGLSSYAALLVPGHTKPIYAVKEDVYTGERKSFEKVTPAVVERIPESVEPVLDPETGTPLFDPATGKDIVIVHPAETITIRPESRITIEYEEKKRGRWSRVPSLPEITGAVSYPPEPMGPGAAKWWRDAAKSKGLDSDYVPTAKEFLALPILTHTGVRL